MPSLNALRVEVEAWLEELGRARARAAPGVAQLGGVDQRHREVVSPETARAVGTLLASSRVPAPELPRLRMLVRFLEDASLEAAAREGRTALEASRWHIAPESGLEAPLAEAEAELPRTDERLARLHREAAVDRGWEALLSTAQRVQAELADGRARSAASLRRCWTRGGTRPGRRSTPLASSARPRMRTATCWAGRWERWRRGSLRFHGDATLADLDRVRALPGYPGALEPADEALRAWAGRLPDAEERARHLRTRTVPAAAARAIAVEVPGQIELLLPAATDGAEAPRRFFWTGCALHLGSVEAAAPVEHRRMGDRAVVAASGWVVRGLLWHERWLREALGLARPRRGRWRGWRRWWRW
jgi:hypothetical protein